MKSFCLLSLSCVVFTLYTNAQNDHRIEPFSIVLDVGPAIQQTRTGGGVIEINPEYTIAGRYKAGIQLACAGFDENKVNSYILTLVIIYSRVAGSECLSGVAMASIQIHTTV